MNAKRKKNDEARKLGVVDMPVITAGAFSGENVHTVVGRATHTLVYLRIEFMITPGMY